MFKRLLSLVYIALILLPLCGCSLLLMPHLEQGGTVHITPTPEPSYRPKPTTTAIPLLDPSTLDKDVKHWPQQVWMDYADYGSRGEFEEKQVIARKVSGGTDPRYIPGGYSLYLPDGFSHYSSHNAINVSLEAYNSQFNEKACTGFYLLVYDDMDDLLQEHREAFEQGYGPDPAEYGQERFKGYDTLVYTRQSEGKTVYHHDLNLTGADCRYGRLTIMRFSYVEGFEKSVDNMFWVAQTLRLPG